MKKLIVFINLIFLFIAGCFTAICPSADAAVYNNINVIKNYNVAIEQNIDLKNDGTIQAYGLTDEHHFLSKNNSDNSVIYTGVLDVSQSGFNNIKSMDSFGIIKTFSHSNYSLNLSRVYLTQTSPRAP